MGNPRINVQDSFYVNGVPIPASYFQTLDTRQSQAINADAGGTWAPGAPVTIAGAGVWLAGPWSTSAGVGIKTLPGSGKRLVHAAADVPLLAAGHDLRFHIIDTACIGGSQVSPGPPSVTLGLPVSGAVVMSGDGGRLLVPLDVHNGATFALVALTLRAATHSGIPSTTPSMRVYAVDAFGNVLPLGGTPGTAGFVSLPAPLSVSGYSATTLTLLYPINAGVVIDRLFFSYFAEIVDESGANATVGNQYQFLRSTFNTISGLYFP
jgi:hypothetical protein